MARQFPWVNLRTKKWRFRDGYSFRVGSRTLRESLILGLLVCLVVVILGSACTPHASTQINGAIASADCRVIRHAKGETCVPNNPQRIVVLGGLDDALSLGLKPIGSDGLNAEGIHLSGMLGGIEDVGGSGAPSIEKILALQPDFIIGGDYAAVDYGTLSKIAPTVLITFEHSGQWKEFFMRFAEVLGQTAAAERVMGSYNARIEEFQAQMGDRAANMEVSIVRVYPTHVNLYLKDSFCGTVVADAGLSRPPAQNLTASEASALFGNNIQYTISREKLSDADGDVIFLWSYGHQLEIAQQAKAEKAKLMADPLWSTLTAVQKGQVYEVPSYWIGDGPIAANAILDDLFTYLVEPS
ncbi:MAG: iron-siderophore ABC transporter substrate-binding protein [Leptolyngbya sp. DLM2.Bin27]|nr:MAG: iron-siderophore ABC transporter substrate-binding protein [Leptolyngbya sp. DLM2.Bin27]